MIKKLTNRLTPQEIDEALRSPFLDEWLSGIEIDECAVGGQRFYTHMSLGTIEPRFATAENIKAMQMEVGKEVKNRHEIEIKMALLFGAPAVIDIGRGLPAEYMAGFVHLIGRLPTEKDSVRVIASEYATEPEMERISDRDVMAMQSRIVRLEVRQ